MSRLAEKGPNRRYCMYVLRTPYLSKPSRLTEGSNPQHWDSDECHRPRGVSTLERGLLLVGRGDLIERVLGPSPL